jgi:protein-L-isoaspartate(D-aspartate) O-methyltransferase
MARRTTSGGQFAAAGFDHPILRGPTVPMATISASASAARRQTMIDSQLRTVGIMDGDVLRAFEAVDREAFVPAGFANLAYGDAAIEVAPGRWLLEPMTLALLLQNARIVPSDRALVVGAATGYSAAILGQIGARTLALESDPALAAVARSAGIDVVEAPLTEGWASAAPYDLILFEGSIEFVPPALTAQLASGGRVAAVVRHGSVASAHAGPVLANGRIGGLAFLEVAARPLPGFSRPRYFAF